jgi:hypothetical protein
VCLQMNILSDLLQFFPQIFNLPKIFRQRESERDREGPRYVSSSLDTMRRRKRGTRERKINILEEFDTPPSEPDCCCDIAVGADR